MLSVFFPSIQNEGFFSWAAYSCTPQNLQTEKQILEHVLKLQLKFAVSCTFGAIESKVMRPAMASLINRVVPVYLGKKTDVSAINGNAVSKAAEALKWGKLVALPTDTIYGLACSAQHNQGLLSLYAIKKRDSSKPIAICLSDVEDVFKWSKVTVSNDVLNDLLPGPVTILFERLNCLNSALNPDTNLIGIRIPDNEFIRRVARMCGFPLALTSANLSTWKSSLSVNEFEDLWPSLEIVCDGGQLGDRDPERLGSTVVDLSRQGTFRIIRDGCASNFVKKVLIQRHLKES